MAAAKPAKHLDVTILDRQYRVACPDEEREELMASVAYLDRKMREIKETGKIAGADRADRLMLHNDSYLATPWLKNA